jgi:hypothetical protein
MRIRFFFAPDDAAGAAAAAQTEQQQQAPSIFDAAGAAAGAGTGAAKPDAAATTPDGIAFPDWVPQNFRRDKPAELTVDQIKMLSHLDIEGAMRSQADLRSKLGTGAYKPPAKPEEYAFEMPQDVALEIPDGDPVMAAFKANAHAAGLSKEQFAKLASPMIATMAKIAAEKGGAALTPEQIAAQAQEAQAQQVKNFEAEIAKLGPNGKDAVLQTGKWLKALETQGKISPEEFSALRAISNADGVNALRKLMNMTGEKPIPIDLGEAATGLSMEDAKNLLTQAHAKLQTNPNDQKGLAERERAIKALERYEKAGQLQGPIFT